MVERFDRGSDIKSLQGLGGCWEHSMMELEIPFGALWDMSSSSQVSGTRLSRFVLLGIQPGERGRRKAAVGAPFWAGARTGTKPLLPGSFHVEHPSLLPPIPAGGGLCLFEVELFLVAPQSQQKLTFFSTQDTSAIFCANSLLPPYPSAARRLHHRFPRAAGQLFLPPSSSRWLYLWLSLLCTAWCFPV